MVFDAMPPTAHGLLLTIDGQIFLASTTVTMSGFLKIPKSETLSFLLPSGVVFEVE